VKHLKPYTLFERVSKETKVFESSSISKAHLVLRIKWYSNHLHQYMKDVNKYTKSNLNFSFSYDTELTISQIFEAADQLQHDSPDGFITAVCNEFITWSEYMINQYGRVASDLPEYRIDKGYENFTDEYKEEHKNELYRQQQSYWMVYAATGRDLKESIDGTIWDIPLKKTFTDKDNEFIIDSLITDFDVEDDYISKISQATHYRRNKRGVIVKLPHISPLRTTGITYDSDLIHRLQSYFNGVLILDRGAYGSDIRIYIPFYK